MTEEEIKYEKIQRIRKVVMIVIVFLLILWIIAFFYMTSKSKKTNSTDDNYQKNQQLMEQAIKSYFNDTMLKDNVVVISLKKMYDNNLLDKLSTSYEEDCIDIASFAKISKLKDKYQLDIILVCGDKSETKTSYYDLQCGLNCEEIK